MNDNTVITSKKTEAPAVKGNGGGRVLEIELMKTVAIIGMIFVHIYEEAECDNVIESGAGYYIGIVIEFMGGAMSAGAFMFAMGWGAAYSSRTTPKVYIRRAVKLYLIGIIINVFEQWIPILLDPVKFGPLSTIWYSIFAVDIYFFAALIMLYFALMKKLESRPKLKFAVSAALVSASLIICAVITPGEYTTGNDVGDMFLGLFLYTNEYIYFPFIVWVAIPIFGYGAGLLYRRLQNRKKFLIIMLSAGLPTVIIASLIMKAADIPNAVFMTYFIEDPEYYSMHTLSIIGFFGFIAVEFVLLAGVLRLIGNKLPQVVMNMSRCVMNVYIFQWFFIGFFSRILRENGTNIWVVLLISVFVTAASYPAALLLSNVFDKRK